jgi:hypothetical protein
MVQTNQLDALDCGAGPGSRAWTSRTTSASFSIQRSKSCLTNSGHGPGRDGQCETKEDLLWNIIEDVHAQWSKILHQATSLDAGPAERVHAFIAMHVEWYLTKFVRSACPSVSGTT